MCVVYAFCNPDFLGRRLGGIYLVHHPCGYKIIVVAMDEEHGLRTASHLREGRRFLKVPSVLELANPAGRVEQREGGKSEKTFQLFAELVPHAGIATVFYETGDVFRRFSPDTIIVVAAPIEIP